VALSGQDRQSLRDLEPITLLYVSASHGWHGDELLESLYLPAGHAKHDTHDSSVHSVPSPHGWHSCAAASKMPNTPVYTTPYPVGHAVRR
jgi:hypothetical protein